MRLIEQLCAAVAVMTPPLPGVCGSGPPAEGVQQRVSSSGAADGRLPVGLLLVVQMQPAIDKRNF